MKAMTRQRRRIIAALTAVILLAAFFIRQQAQGFILSDFYDHPAVAPTWTDVPDQWIAAHPQYAGYKKTGLAFNLSGYYDNQSWPLGGAMYLQARNGYENPEEFKRFEGRHTYCSGSHESAVAIAPGARAFCSGEYRIGQNLFEEAVTGKSNPNFNFLMLAIACSYPGDYKVKNDNQSSYEDPEAASDAVIQAIAWMATDRDSPGFTGEAFTNDFQLFKSKYYDRLMTAFIGQPEMDNWLKAAPKPSAQVTQYGLANMADALFYDIWCASYLTAQLTPKWDEQIATFTAPMKEEDGEYVVEIEIPNEPGILNYMTGIKLKGHGDWIQTESLAEHTLRFTSASGELDEYGSIGYLYWPKEYIGGLMPVDPTKAHLYTFDTFNLSGDLYPNGAFGRTQTQFASYTEQGLNIYVTVGEGEPDSGDLKCEVVRHKHTETWDSTYTVNLYKFDSETGKPIEGARWDILEKFDDSQLANTDLDRTPDNPGTYTGGIGDLVSTEWGNDTVEENYTGEMGVTVSDTNRYNWGNDQGSQFIRWDDPKEDPCRRDENVTGPDGKLYEIDSSGNISGDAAHTDTYTYHYMKGYCDGHPAPEFDYVECDHEGDCDCEEINQEIHDEGWKAWKKEVETCEQLVEEGGFFHCITTDGAAKAALEEDRDQFYQDFISLTYEYSAEEVQAAKGYILHGIHTDDIPIEWRVVTSSEYKDTAEAGNLEHSGVSDGKEEGDDEDDDEKEQPDLLYTGRERRADRAEEHFVTNVQEGNGEEEESLSAHARNRFETATKSNADWIAVSARKDRKQEAEAEDEEEGLVIGDLDIFSDETVIATPSVATGSDAMPETVKKHTGLTDGLLRRTARLLGLSRDMDETEEETEDMGSSLRNQVTLTASLANCIKQAVHDIVDWTFIVYDHRTEGEIHFNKRDFNLSLSTSDKFGAYGQENGDGTLEGAVYGLFAAEDILHPDTTSGTANEYDTGVVFREGDLVAIAATDRNGDGSFMAITEAPGTYYDYASGETKHNEWYSQAPKNLYIREEESAAKETDMECFLGHNPDHSEIKAGNGQDLRDTSKGDGNDTQSSFWKYSSNQLYDSGMLSHNKVTNQTQDVYREERTTGHSPLSDNEADNGNCWIGRPLIISPDGSTYYIRELSRSEGYELSVFGKNKELSTNRQAFADGEVTVSRGSVQAAGIEAEEAKGEFTYTIKSSDTDNGYLIRLSNIPEGGTIYRTVTEYVWDDQVSNREEVVKTVPMMAKEGDLVMIGGKTWKASVGDTISFNGKTFTVNQVQTIPHGRQKVQPDNTERFVNPYLDPTSITISGNVLKDVNSALSRLGYRKSVNGAPWTVIEVDSFTVEQVAKAINEKIFADSWYHVFNSFSVQDSFYENGHAYVAVSYCYRLTAINNALYNEENDRIYVKTEADYEGLPSSAKGFIYRVYDPADCEEVVKNSNGFVTSATVPNETAEGTAAYLKGQLKDTIQFKVRPDETLWSYGSGEQLLNMDGEPATREEKDYVEVTPTRVKKITDTPIAACSFTIDGRDELGIAYGTYEYQMTQEELDSLKSDTISFRVIFDGTLQDSALKAMQSGKRGVVSVTLPLVLSGSYIESVVLTYPGQEQVMQDAGTVQAPITLMERPIRQKVKISKDIGTFPQEKQVWYCMNCGYENTEGLAFCGFCSTVRTTEEIKTITYANDTYSAVHSENISARRNGGWYDTISDWLTKLLEGREEPETASSIPNFRFKAYLKSNLERLYRDEDGNITWTDRNGNRMKPVYEDTNQDGNYDTFVWQYEEAYVGRTVDFPEKDILSESGELESSNVQKIYTRVIHNPDSKTTSAQANNVWSDYGTPQGGERSGVGEKKGFITSERETVEGSAGDLSGMAVRVNSALYSYQGKNTDAARSDRLNENQNTGYTRLLEITDSLPDHGMEGSGAAEAYNYEKFFDAIYAANQDVWDNDMHTTYNGEVMDNDPGQHWFETFYEKYQKDDHDPNHTLEDTDGSDLDGSAGGDRDTSFKPFRWIREHLYGKDSDYGNYPAKHNGVNTETDKSTSEFARANAKASDAVRQFATKWYLKQEAAKLLKSNGVGENIAKEGEGRISYDEAVYDEALFHAIAKAYGYLKPFYLNDLDTIYSVQWDSAAGGGSDQDDTTLSADMADGREHYGISSYLPYGIYVIVEQQPERIEEKVDDWKNRSYSVEKPKEVVIPSVYEGTGANFAADNYDPFYAYDKEMSTEEQASESRYLIRFGEEWSRDVPNRNQDERQYVIRAHNYHGDYEIYKYGLDIDKLNSEEKTYPDGRGYTGIRYGGETFFYAGWNYTQEDQDPLKDYYDTNHRGDQEIQSIGKENGGCDNSHYMAVHKTNGAETANGSNYDGKALKDRFFYGSISEDAGRADKGWKKGAEAMTGELTAYDGRYGSMLVPWTVTAPADLHDYESKEFSGYADVNERNGFFSTFLRINKTDSETGEYILHDNAVFGLFAGSRYQTFAEIKEDARLIQDKDEQARFLAQFRPGDAKFYLQDTVIQGTREFLMAMGARDIVPFARGRKQVESSAGTGELCSGIVPKGTPICLESERIMLADGTGARSGQMTVYTTLNDVWAAGEENASQKKAINQNTGYLVTPQPVGAGVYILAEIKAPDGYARSKPVAFEVYSDKTQYYVDGDMYSKVTAVRYDGDFPVGN